jgi:hypothetical protein
LRNIDLLRARLLRQAIEACMITAGGPEMRLTTIALCAFLCAASAAAQLVDREAVFTRAREIAAATLGDVETADLAPFRVAYGLTLLETGNPEGTFEVTLLLRSSREVLTARDVIAAEPDAESAARLEALLTGAEFAYHYRIIRVRFPEQGDAPPYAEFSTLLLNRDPDTGPAGVSSPLAPEPQPIERSTP